MRNAEIEPTLKKTITLSEAQRIAREASDKLIEAITSSGLIVVGQPNGDGRVITEEDITSLRQAADRAGMDLFEENFTIIPEQPTLYSRVPKID